MSDDLEVKYLDGQAPFAADTDCFLERVHFARAFTSHVGGVDAAVLRRNFRECNQFIGLCVMPGGINERGGESHCTVLHGTRDERLHLFKFRSSRSTIFVADYGFAYLGCANVGREVNGSAILLQALEIAIEGGPINRQTILIQKLLLGGESLFILRRDGTAFARDFGSNSLRQLA